MQRTLPRTWTANERSLHRSARLDPSLKHRRWPPIIINIPQPNKPLLLIIPTKSVSTTPSRKKSSKESQKRIKLTQPTHPHPPSTHPKQLSPLPAPWQLHPQIPAESPLPPDSNPLPCDPSPGTAGKETGPPSLARGSRGGCSLDSGLRG